MFQLYCVHHADNSNRTLNISTWLQYALYLGGPRFSFWPGDQVLDWGTWFLSVLLNISHNMNMYWEDTLSWSICRDIFVMEWARMPFQKFFLRRMLPVTVFWNFFPGISITNSCLRPNFGSLYAFQNLLFRKIALFIWMYHLQNCLMNF
jgi:hypothetical protein